MTKSFADVCMKKAERVGGEEMNVIGDSYLIQFFQYSHLPEHLQVISKPFGILAEMICQTLPDNPERQTAIRKLLEAKDCAVRAQLFRGKDGIKNAKEKTEEAI